MNPRRILPWFPLLLICGSAHGQSSTVQEAINRGMEVRSVGTPKQHKLTPAEWRRRQLAAADKSQQIMVDAQKQPGLLGQYLQMHAAYAGNEDVAFRLIFSQYLSWFQTWVGAYDAALETFSVAQPRQADDAPSPLRGDYRAKDGADVILGLARDRKAVFFNEAHSAPVTRTLTVELLAKLRAQGFDYFAAESLYTTDTDLGKRGYPTVRSGFYVTEPIYGEMIRAALRLGFTVVAYDAEDNGSGDTREKASAEALYAQTFKRDPNARLVLNAGFGHIQKSGEHLGGSSMAEYFEKISGVEPLAIEQTMLIEHAHADQNHPLYAEAVRAAHSDRPFVFVNDAGSAWTLKPGKYDVSVFFPPETSIDDRPGWLGLDGMRAPYPLDGSTCHETFPCLIEARYTTEGDDAVPADRVVLDARDTGARLPGTGPRSALFLYPGQYRLRASDRGDHTLATRTIDVGAAPLPPAKAAND